MFTSGSLLLRLIKDLINIVKCESDRQYSVDDHVSDYVDQTKV